VIRPPRDDELERLRAIERAAGRAFAEVGMPEIAEDEPPSIATLARYRASGWAWVITVDGDGGPRGDDVVAGYVIVDVLDDALVAGASAHVEQVSVDPDFARRGHGRRLLDHVDDRARERGLGALTLTTFRDVPWNAPYYERCGFRVLDDEELGPGLRRVRADEAAHGLDPAARVCMWRPV
jgi:GNAT superfamily N-acetyltransferase